MVLACVVGTVEQGDPPLLTSKISKHPCVACDTNVDVFAGNTAGMPRARSSIGSYGSSCGMRAVSSAS